MSKVPVRLNQKQIDVLEWVRGGCPDGVFADHQHRVVARALERRGLITISGKGSTWAAAITEAGRQWQSADVVPDDSEVDQLIARVLAAEGRLVLELGREAADAHRLLVDRSLKSSARPKGKKLEVIRIGGFGSDEHAIVLTEHFDDLVEPRAVPVPERIAKFHPAVRAFLDDKDWQYVSSEHIPRAARILQALAIEAAERGIDAKAPDSAKGWQARQAGETVTGQLVLRAPDGAYGVQIKEISVRGTAKVPALPWNERKSVPGWIATRGWEFVSTGKLEVVVRGPGCGYNGDHYRDAKSIKVEDKVPEVFRALEIYALRADWRQRTREREKAERLVRWKGAMSVATERYAENARWGHFKDRAREWQLVNQHREFLAAAREHAERYEGKLRDNIMRQLDEAELRVDHLDPIRNLSRIVPVVPDPQPEDLKPFLEGWSPHGPDGSRW
ncbi:hypothetical protein ACFWU5_26890 [Nocardia sp. NPDC058640]|uniref:hypothetical protein n=1 Tax=Nocardia sp. NPDC058640 TaxID=3346571 RepID=UPI00365AE9EE